MLYNEEPVINNTLAIYQNLLNKYFPSQPTFAQALYDYQTFKDENAFEYIYNYFLPKMQYMVSTTTYDMMYKEELLAEMQMHFVKIANIYIPSIINFNTFFYFCMNNTIKRFIAKNNAKKRNLYSVVSINNINQALKDKKEEFDIKDTNSLNEQNYFEALNTIETSLFPHISKRCCKFIQLLSQEYNYEEIADKFNINKRVVSSCLYKLRKTPSFQAIHQLLSEH